MFPLLCLFILSLCGRVLAQGSIYTPQVDDTAKILESSTVPVLNALLEDSTALSNVDTTTKSSQTASLPMILNDSSTVVSLSSSVSHLSSSNDSIAFSALDNILHTATPLDEVPGVEFGEGDDGMESFIPESVVTVTIPGGETDFFYQDVGEHPTLIRGGFFVASDAEDSSIVFTIFDPTGTAVLRFVKNESIFRINTTKSGTYSFHLSNAAWRNTKYVTFGLTAGNDTYLTKEHIKSFNDNLAFITKASNDIHKESQYLWGRQRGQMTRVETSVNWVFWLCLFEVLIMLTIVAFELHFLKALVANRCLF